MKALLFEEGREGPEELREFLEKMDGDVVANCRNLTVGAAGEFRVVDGTLEMAVQRWRPDRHVITHHKITEEDEIEHQFIELFTENELPPLVHLLPYEESLFAKLEGNAEMSCPLEDEEDDEN